MSVVASRLANLDSNANLDSHNDALHPLTDGELAARIEFLHAPNSGASVLVEDVIDRALVEASTLRRVVRHGMALATVRTDANRLQHVLTALIDDVVATTVNRGPYARSITVSTEIVPAGKVIVEIADLRRMWTFKSTPPAQGGQILTRAFDSVSGIVLRAATHFSLGRVLWPDIPCR